MINCLPPDAREAEDSSAVLSADVLGGDLLAVELTVELGAAYGAQKGQHLAAVRRLPLLERRNNPGFIPDSAPAQFLVAIGR